MGLAVGMFQVLWILAVLTNGASVSTVIQCNAPIIVTLLAWVFWREPLTWRKWTAIGLAFAGTFLVARAADPNAVHITLVGLLISLGSAFTYAAITLFTKKLSGRYNPFVILMYSFGFAALALLPFQFGRPLPTAHTPGVGCVRRTGALHHHRRLRRLRLGPAPFAGQRGLHPGDVRGAVCRVLRLRLAG